MTAPRSTTSAPDGSLSSTRVTVLACCVAGPPLPFEATAYSIEGRTASGKHTREGICAADPDILPLGSRIRVHDAGAYSGECEVADTGPGIPQHELPRIFERFYRVDPARTRDMGGTGLGLSIVKHLVQSHGGDVRVESRVGAGSTFRVTFPVVQSAAAV